MRSGKVYSASHRDFSPVRTGGKTVRGYCSRCNELIYTKTYRGFRYGWKRREEDPRRLYADHRVCVRFRACECEPAMKTVEIALSLPVEKRLVVLTSLEHHFSMKKNNEMVELLRGLREGAA